MRTPITVALASLILTVSTVSAHALDYFVSVHGSDRWNGSRAVWVRKSTNGPFATLDHALLIAREFRSNHPSYRKPVTIIVEAGTYWLKQPIRITPADSGSLESPLIIKAALGAHPVFSGGMRIARWQVGANGWWHAHIPAGVNFQELWANGIRRPRPRFPYTGWLTVQKSLPPTAVNAKKGYDQFQYADGQIPASFENQDDVDVLCVHIWAMARNKIATIDPKTRTLVFKGPSCSLSDWAKYNAGDRFVFSNVKEDFQVPGQWYFDRPIRTLMYIPLTGEKPGNTKVVIPKLRRLLTITGNAEQNSFVRDVQINGLTFSHTSYMTPALGHDFPQADADLGAAIELTAARHVTMQNCRVEHTGAWAIQLGEACRYDVVRNCIACDLGSGGVKVGETTRRNGRLNAGHDSVLNCIIAACGRIHPAATGVWIGCSSHNIIDHNTIADLYYTGVSVGWTWGYAPSQANHNVISNNVIEQVGQGVLSDMGGIYLLGVAPGTTLKHNLLRNITSATYGGWGIYFDEGTSYVTAINNVVYNTKSGGLHQHYGANNVVRNNIFAFSRSMQIRRSLAENHLSFTFDHNIVYWTTGTLLGINWTGSEFKMDYNLYWNAAGKPVDFAGATFAQWQARGQDIHSEIANPRFVDAARGDFELRSNSPARSLGISPIQMGGWGSSLPAELLTAALRVPQTFPTVPLK